MVDQEPGAWVPLRQAADMLGVSTDTVRRRIQRGEVASRREETPQGYRWLVRIDIDASHGAPGPSKTHGTPAQGSAPALVADSSQELIATLRGELAQRVREVAELHAVILAQAKALESSAAALPATVESGADDLSSPGAPARAVTPVERASRSWRTWIRRAVRGG